MKLSPIKNIVSIFLLAALQNAFAETAVNEALIPGYCSHMSNNPRCWQENNNADLLHACSSRHSCHVIKSVHQDSWGNYHCRSSNKDTFYCDELVQQFGTSLQGYVVKVTVPYIDSCHVQGKCGPKACMPGYGSARLDQSCQ